MDNCYFDLDHRYVTWNEDETNLNSRGMLSVATTGNLLYQTIYLRKNNL